MFLSTVDRHYIDSAIKKHGLAVTWKGFLRARIKASGTRFAYMLRSTSLSNAAEFPVDILQRLTPGEVSVLYEYSLARASRAKRKDQGQYFTPDDVSQFLAKQTKRFSSSTVWMDPCSGVGNLSYWLLREQKNPESFLLKQLYLVDTDSLALLIARVLMTLSFQEKEERLFEKLNSRFLNLDFLTAPTLPACDAAILNPPYVSGIRNDSFETSSTRNTYAYFLERVSKLCKGGYVSITPQTFTNATSFSSLRRLLINRHKSINVYCFDNVPDNIFSGIKFGSGNTNKANSTRAGIIVAMKARTRQHRITPLLRWRTHERAQMLASADEFLSETVFAEDIFPKVSRELKKLYASVHRYEKLGQLLAAGPSTYQLQVPSTPRYFISANKTPVYRTSFKTLYFKSEQDLDRVYVILNSSYMYWWWRVRDGGMTISEKTLLDLPIPKIDLTRARAFVRKLEKSESSSKVVKMNAGKAIENIKHSVDLIYSLTEFLFPSDAKYLTATHSNTNLNSHIVIQQKIAF